MELSKRLEYGNVIVDLGRAGVIKRDRANSKRNIKNEQVKKAYCYEVKKRIKGPSNFLSRAHPQF